MIRRSSSSGRAFEGRTVASPNSRAVLMSGAQIAEERFETIDGSHRLPEPHYLVADRLHTVNPTGMFGAKQSEDWPPEESAPGEVPRGAEKAPQSDDRNASGYCDGKARIRAWSIERGGSLRNFNENHHDDEKSRVSGLGCRWRA